MIRTTPGGIQLKVGQEWEGDRFRGTLVYLEETGSVLMAFERGTNPGLGWEMLRLHQIDPSIWAQVPEKFRNEQGWWVHSEDNFYFLRLVSKTSKTFCNGLLRFNRNV